MNVGYLTQSVLYLMLDYFYNILKVQFQPLNEQEAFQ
jgi:hypothetical protein